MGRVKIYRIIEFIFYSFARIFFSKPPIFMKHSIIILCFLNYMFCYSQKHGTDLQIDYKVYCDTDYPLTFFSTLSISGQTSIYQEKFTTSQDWDKGDKNDTADNNVTEINSEIPYDPYIKIDIKNKEILFFNYIINNNYIIRDNYVDLKWKITEVTKKIADYNCIKATTNFRGREWIAWFTLDIPVPFGPWKLHGLPGLILETNDVTSRFAIKAVKIENKKNEIFTKDFKTLMVTKNKEPITYKQFLQNEEEAMENAHKQLNQSVEGSVTTVKAPRNSEELKFEWEE